MAKQDLVSLGELSLELGCNKSKLNYYFSKGLLNPVTTVGKMNVFDREDTVKRIKKIDDLQGKGKTLKDITGILS